MAKGNMFLGQAKGKVGSVVFSRAFGQQITRTKPSSVANPKTIGQNTQRAILATIAKSAAALTPLVDHSFANVAYGAESVRHFRKINMGILRNLYLSTQNDANLVAKGGNFVPNPLKISEGSLPSFNAVVDDADAAFFQTENTLPSGQDITVADFLEAYPYIQGGDQLTLVKIKKISGSLLDGDGLFAMALDRIVFAPNAFDDPDAIIITEAAGTIERNFLDLTKTTDPSCLSYNTAVGGLGFSDEICYYTALILSRKVNNVWQRSTQFLSQVMFNDQSNNESAIASYGASVSLLEATEYLNQADEGETHGGISSAYMNVTTKVGNAAAVTDSVNAGSSINKAASAKSGTLLSISAQAYAPTGKRLITVEVDRPDGSFAAHGAKSVNYILDIAQKNVGNWKIVALYDDGAKAEYVVAVNIEG